MSNSIYSSKDKRKIKLEECTAEQLLRLERLENMGLLATRVAHDLNNMLAPMKMAIPLIRPAVADAAAGKLLDTLENTVGRAAALVRQILEYAEGAGGQFQVVPVNQLLEEVVLFVRQSFPRTIRIEAQIPLDLWLVNANLSQLHQVLLNLCVNARDAMERGGTLSLRAENCELNAAMASGIEGGREGSFLVMQVYDTGMGLSPEVQTRMWEPFFTTKKSGDGLGVGLSTIRDIITHHNGFIQLRTGRGRGTAFRIYLPAMKIAGPYGTHPFGSSVRPLVEITA